MSDYVCWADLSDDEMEFGDPSEVFGKLPEVPRSDTSNDEEEDARQLKIKDAQKQAQLVKKKKRGATTYTTPQRMGSHTAPVKQYSGLSDTIGSWRRKLPLTISQPDLDQVIEEVTSPADESLSKNTTKCQLTVTESHVFTSPVSDPSISDIAASLVNMQW
eukprot:TRINITY_DN1071_c1_g1_i1.p1 TRINITY_DN1071_c1_g1~~TRINITY_DN1071_c1_g1_i1.p1  ORF type:complete len:177 (+),score=36.45 TRINITY_DN1071_c1_g1_i1:49-531(+)